MVVVGFRTVFLFKSPSFKIAMSGRAGGRAGGRLASGVVPGLPLVNLFSKFYVTFIL